MTRPSSSEVVYDPRGTVTVVPAAPARRLTTLEQMRLGVLDNSKWNASRLLRAIVERLNERHTFAAVTLYKKESFSRVAPETLVERIHRETDAVITAIGD